MFSIFTSKDPNKEINLLLDRGKNLLEKNFYDWAAVEFNKALELNQNLATATITKLFQEMQGGGNPDGIISLGINVLKMDPKNIDLANLLGNTYRRKQDWKHAKNMYHLCLKHDPDNKNATYNLAAAIAKIEIADGNAISAIGEFEKMTDFVLPDVEDGLEKLHEIQKHFEVVPDDENTDLAEGETEGETTKETEEETVKVEEEEEEEEENNIDTKQSFDYIIANLEAETDEEQEVFFALGIYCLKTKQGKIAHKVFKLLLMREKENVDLRCFLVLAISLTGGLEKAINTLHSLLGRNPNHRYSNVNLGILYKLNGNIQQSRVSFFTTFKLLSRSQGDYEIHKCLKNAEILFNDNREKKALEIYKPLVSEIKSEELLLRIAKLFLDQNLSDDTLEIYKRIIRINRQNKEAREGIKAIHATYLTASENCIKNNELTNAVAFIDKAMKIAVNKKLLEKAIKLNQLLENDNRTVELEQILKNFNTKVILDKVQEKISLAEEAETKGQYKQAILFYEEAIKIDPQNSTLKKLVDLCTRIKRPDLAEKLTTWFIKFQHSKLEQEKSLARNEFENSKSNKEESQQDEI